MVFSTQSLESSEMLMKLRVKMGGRRSGVTESRRKKKDRTEPKPTPEGPMGPHATSGIR